MLYLFYNKLFIFYTISLINSFKLSTFESSIGKWNLLYSTNKHIKFEGCCLEISPLLDNIDQLSVQIKRYEKNKIINYIKIINCNVFNSKYDLILNIDNIFNKDDIFNKDECSLVVLKTEKIFKSIGIFEFPYFAIKYISELNSKYIINWKIDTQLNRLYIYFDGNTYVFEKNHNNLNSNINSHESITTNTFIITNILSFLLGKLLEKTIHLS